MDKFDDIIDKTWRKINKDKILIVFVKFSTLSNFIERIKQISNKLNVKTFIGIAYLRVISALNAWRLFWSRFSNKLSSWHENMIEVIINKKFVIYDCLNNFFIR